MDQPVKVNRMKKLALCAVSLILAGCTPVISHRGYLEDPNIEANITAGNDSKATIETKLGDPSMSATFSNDSWYYVSTVEKQVGFFSPIIQSRKVLAIYFDADGKVTELKHYGLEDGHIFAFETRQTPARGREMTFLQQLFNATPGMPGMSQQEQSPGGGGGPPGT
jgi:outer membrane protein assembly factor BamE (lipoprotein component of BamABCDE complex)